MPVIEVTSLTKRYGKTVAVDDLTFGVARGRITGFLGPNGAGKTTTLRVLLGLVEPTTGAATIMGRPYRSLDEPAVQVGAVLGRRASTRRGRAEPPASAGGGPASRTAASKRCSRSSSSSSGRTAR